MSEDPDTGEPTGVLLEMNDYLEGVAPPPSQAETDEGVRLFNEECPGGGHNLASGRLAGELPGAMAAVPGHQGAGAFSRRLSP